MTTADLILYGVAFAVPIAVAVKTVGRLRRSCRLHQPRANKIYLAGYRAGFRCHRVDPRPAPAPASLPVIRSRPGVDGSGRRGRHAA